MALTASERRKRYYLSHKEAVLAYNKEYRINNRKKFNEYEKKWKDRHREEHLERHKQYQKKYVEQNEDVKKAHAKVRMGISSGTILKSPCEKCGVFPAEAHHDDYNKPLDVRWLCRKCHAEWHRNNKPIKVKEK